MAYNAGTAFISIAPSFRGFNTKVAAHMRTIGAVKVPVDFKVPTKPIVPPPIKQPVIRPEVDTRGAVAQLSRLESRLDRLARGRFIINIGIAASPLAIPAAAVGAGALGALGAVGAAGLAGVAGFAAVASSGLDRVTKSQEALTAATEERGAAVQSLRAAESSLAAAVEASRRAQIDGARQIADAERALADARRSAGRAVSDAERALADARRAAARSVTDAERALTDARQEAARQSQQAQQAVVRAQDDLVASQDRVRRSLDDLHAAREQAKRDLADLAERTRDNALTVEGAEIGLIEAQQRLAELEAGGEASAIDLRKARLDLAVAEDRLSDARQQAAEDTQRLADAEKAGIEGSAVVQGARAELEEARQARRDAQAALAEANRAARQAEAEAARAVADAERNLAQTRADASRSVADAERNLSQTRADAARSVADAERNLAVTREQAARSAADAQRQVAEAQAGVAAAAAAVAAATQAQNEALAGLGPAQKAAAAGMERLNKAWAGFLGGSAGSAVLRATVRGMDALIQALPALGRFITPVARGMRDMFAAFGNAAASGPFQRFATILGRFAREVLADATRGILNLARGFGNLFIAFMPLGSDMSDGLVRLTKRFADWSATVGDSAGFRSFVAYVRETGPVLLSTFGALVKAFIAVGVALAPMAAAMLEGVRAFAEWVAETAKAHPWLVRIIAGFGLLVAGVSAIAKPLAAIVGVFRLLTMGIGAAVAIVKIVVFNLKVLWLVLKANPVGLVITIIGLLVAGLVTAYKTSDTFRAIVDKAWAAIKRAIRSAWEDHIRPALKAMWRFIRDTLWPIIQELWTQVVKPTFQKIGEFIVWTWNNVVKPLFGLWKAYMTEVLFPVLRFLWENVVKPVFKGLGETISFAWNQVIKPVFKALKGFIEDTLVPAFRTGIGKIADIWDGLKKAAQAPVKFVVNTIWNNGLRKMLNAIPGVSDFPEIELGFARGGWTGPGERLRPAGIVHADEFVLQKSARRALEGMMPGALDYMNRTGRWPGYAGGGTVWPAAGDVNQHLSGYPWATWSGDINQPGSVDYGAPVRAYRDGSVASTAFWDYSYGNHVRLNHEGASTLYAHLSKILVSPGQAVTAGQLIGLVGSTGNSSGPHLHFEIMGGSASPFAGVKTEGSAEVGGFAVSRWLGAISEVKDMFSAVRSGVGRLGQMTGGFAPLVATAARSGGNSVIGWINDALPNFGPIPDDPIPDLFDTGGLARTAGLMAKGPEPERILSPRETVAFERALEGGFESDGRVLRELQSQSQRLASIESTVANLPRDARDLARSGWGRP